jgi:hypothetical protein
MKRNSHHAALLASLLTLLLAAAGCGKGASSPTSFFPNSAEAPGWSKSGEIRTFSPEHLSDYIDGDAEKYLKAGVKSTSTADYKFKDQTEVVVDVYTMSSPQGAKTIFDSEPAMDSQNPALGDAARLFSQSLIFRKGPYLVRMVAYQESPQIAPAMLALGHAMETKLTR